jgi:crotonobetainyl-CoA:carnitine CoA-transferase CaiB-like acyl-CoA transferase|tara:strand:- start:1269 stop:2465 length:1197 start_codon:yes stop_codon:yes gene_type:complete
MGVKRALDGVQILDCTQILAGPFCTMLLADMGADVIKIEKPAGGDDTRRMGPPFVDDTAAAFLMVNRNKRSITVDLKNENGIYIFKELAKKSDILVENLRPGTMEKLGLSYSEIRSIKPEIVYCSISGFGATGPYSKRSGFDLVAQGMSGHMSFTGHPDSEPVKLSVPISDLNAGMFAAYGILSAYINRLKTGEGQYLDTSLLEAGIAYTMWESASLFYEDVIPTPVGSRHRMAAPYQAYSTSDGYINIGVANQGTWIRLCDSMDRAEMKDDPRFSTNAKRVENLSILKVEIEKTLQQHDTEHWWNQFIKFNVPSGPIYDMKQVYEDKHVQAREMMLDIKHPSLGDIKNVGFGVKLSGTPASVRMPPPDLGQHNQEVLESMGFKESDIARLKQTGGLG